MILQNKPTSININNTQIITLNVSELSSSISGEVDTYESNSTNWKVVEFIYKNDTQIKRLIFRLNKNITDYSLTFNEYSLLGNFECVKIRIEDYQADTVVIKRDQFASLFESTALFDMEVGFEIVDTTAPFILSYQAPQPGTYNAGSNLDYDVTFSEPVIVQGIPSITILDATLLETYFTVNYISGSGTSTLKFRYTVQSDLTPKTDITIRPLSPIHFSTSGSIRDAAGNNSQLTFDSILSGPFTFNNNVNSSIYLIFSTSSPVFAPSILRFELWFTNPVTISNPTDLKLNIVIGSTNKVMDYEIHSTDANQTMIRFGYTVQTGDYDGDGVLITSLDLGTSTIVNSFSGNPADTSAIPFQSNILIGTNPIQANVWEFRDTPPGAWNKVIYGADKFVVVGNADSIIYSLDGVTWLSGTFTDTILSGANWTGVCYSSELGKYVAVANTGTKRVATSPDGITWTLHDAVNSNTNTWISVAYGAGVFSAVSALSTESAGNRIMYSIDGVTWSNSGVTTGSVAIGTAYHITYQNGWFLISRENTSVNETRVIKSTNGINFTNSLIESGNQNPILTEIIADEYFVGVAGVGAARRSLDTNTWTTTSYPTLATGFGANIYHGLTAGIRPSTSQLYYFAITRTRSSNQVIRADGDGTGWVLIGDTGNNSQGWHRICYAQGMLVIINNGTHGVDTQRVMTQYIP